MTRAGGHRIPGRARVRLGGAGRVGHSVLSQHGDRAVHARHRGDRAHRVQPVLAALGLVFAILTLFANLWPGWATSSATMVTYLWGGNVTWITIGMLLVIGLIRTLAPVVYVALERAEMLKVAAVLVLLGVGAFVAISADAWADVPKIVTDASVPTELGFALLLGALAFAGAGGGQNLVQSNWIRDKGFGMGKYVPRITSPVTGQPEAAPSTGFIFEPTEEHLGRRRAWWRFANREQLSTSPPPRNSMRRLRPYDGAGWSGRLWLSTVTVP